MEKCIVYTAITQGYDTLKPVPDHWLREADFVAFLDAPQNSSAWNFRPICSTFHDPCRNAKIHKMLPHKFFPEAEYSLWIDGSISIKSPKSLKTLIHEYLGSHDLALFKHRSRDCCYDEAYASMRKGRDPVSLIGRQMLKYYDEGFPRHYGLTEAGIIFRRHTEKVRLFNEKWHEEVQAFSRRDQLSFNYAAHAVGLAYFTLPGDVANNSHFEWWSHSLAPVKMGELEKGAGHD